MDNTLIVLLAEIEILKSSFPHLKVCKLLNRFKFITISSYGLGYKSGFKRAMEITTLSVRGK